MRRPTLPSLPDVVARRDGILTRREAVEWGLTHPRLRRLLAAGLLRPVLGTTLAAQLPPWSPWALGWAAWLVTQRVPSHTLAAALWGLPTRPDPHVTGPPPVHAVVRGLVDHRSALAADEVVRQVRQDLVLPLTCPARTVLDCATVLPLEPAVAIGAAALQRRLVTLDDLRAAAARRHGRPGVTRIRDLVAQLATQPHSVGEWRFHRLLAVACPGVAWAANVPVHDREQLVAVADVLMADVVLVLEFDGKRYHEDMDRRRYDRRRDRLLTTLGYTVLRFEWDDVVRHPERVIAEVMAVRRRLLDQRYRGERSGA